MPWARSPMGLEQRYRKLFETLPVGCFSLDQHGVIQEANVRGSELLEIDRSRIPGKPLEEYVEPSQHKIFLQHLNKARQRSFARARCGFQTAQGHHFVGEIRTVWSGSDGTGEAPFQTTIIDNTPASVSNAWPYAERRTELACSYRRTALRELGRKFTHALVQPTTAIHNYTETALVLMESSEQQESPFYELLEQTRRQTEHMIELLRVLRSSLPELWVLNTLLDLKAIVGDAANLAMEETQTQGVDLRLSLEPCPTRVRGDSTLLTQALVNVIQNALEAMNTVTDQTVQLDIGCQSSEDGKQVTLGIHDMGSGIPAELRERIFEPLFSTKPSGLGMGLPVAQAIAEAHGGNLRLEPGAPHGAFFLFHLPTCEGG
jgi:PAS domain S-box-containing protein